MKNSSKKLSTKKAILLGVFLGFLQFLIQLLGDIIFDEIPSFSHVSSLLTISVLIGIPMGLLLKFFLNGENNHLTKIEE